MRFPFMRLSLLAGFLLSGIATAQNDSPPSEPPPPPPKNLPDPPPLPEDVRESKPGEPPSDLPDPAELIEQLKQLDSLLRMPPNKLKRLRQTIEFIEKMSDSEREAMRIRLSQITQSTPELKKEINDMAQWIDDLNKNDISQFWLSLKSQDRKRLRNHFQSLEKEKKASLLKEKVQSFIQERDRVFQKMQNKLDRKKEELLESSQSSEGQ